MTNEPQQDQQEQHRARHTMLAGVGLAGPAGAFKGFSAIPHRGRCLLLAIGHMDTSAAGE